MLVFGGPHGPCTPLKGWEKTPAPRLCERVRNKLRDTEALEEGSLTRSGNEALHFTGLSHGGARAGFLTLRNMTLRRSPLRWAPAEISSC